MRTAQTLGMALLSHDTKKMKGTGGPASSVISVSQLLNVAVY